MNPAALREAEAARYIGLRPATLRDLRCQRSRMQGPRYTKLGRIVVYLVKDLDAWLEAQRASTPMAPPEPCGVVEEGSGNPSNLLTQRTLLGMDGMGLEPTTSALRTRFGAQNAPRASNPLRRSPHLTLVITGDSRTALMGSAPLRS